MKILVTGGLGFIGSHAVVELLDEDYEVVVIDDLSNSSSDVVDKIKEITGKDFKFYEADVCDLDVLEKIFSEEKIDAATPKTELMDTENAKNNLFFIRFSYLRCTNDIVYHTDTYIIYVVRVLLKLKNKYFCFLLLWIIN